MQFDSLDDIRAFCRDLPGGDARAADAATLRQQALTKPPGSLGRLEELAIWLARWQGREIPQLERVTIAVFAGNHGVAARGVSAYPQAVTEQMVANFASGGAAINQIAGLAAPTCAWCRSNSTARPATSRSRRRWTSTSFSPPSTSDIEPCRRTAICSRSARWGSPTPRRRRRCARHCLAAAPARWAGRGTGVDDAGLERKRAAIEAALDFHRAISGDPLRVAAALGGRELAAIAGAMLAARRHQIPVLLDGFVATAAIVPLTRLEAGILDHCRAGTCLRRIRPPRVAARTRPRPAARSQHAARRSLGRGRRHPAAARGAGLSRRDGDIRRSRRFRRGQVTEPCRAACR